MRFSLDRAPWPSKGRKACKNAGVDTPSQLRFSVVELTARSSSSSAVDGRDVVGAPQRQARGPTEKLAAPVGKILRNHCPLRMGCWCSALAFVRNCGVGPPPGFAFPVALHPYIRPVCAYQFSCAASGIMVSVYRMVWLVAASLYTVASPSVINV